MSEVIYRLLSPLSLELLRGHKVLIEILKKSFHMKIGYFNLSKRDAGNIEAIF